MKILFLCFFVLLSCSQLPSKRTDRFSILQGITNSKEVEFSVLAKKGQDLRFELRNLSGTVIAPDEVKTVSRDFSDVVVHKILFTRTSGEDYNLYVFQGDKVVDQRLIGRGQKETSRLRLAVASCSSDYYSEHFQIWQTLALKNPEYLLLIGDNVYADMNGRESAYSTTPESIWNRYVDTRSTLPLFFQDKLIPAHAVWDDHDYGINDGNKNFSHKQESKDIFDAFYAQNLSEDDWTSGHGVGGLLSLGDFNLYFLDSRSFRSSDKDGSHLGLDQTAWFISKLRDEATPSFIIKGDQFFGGYHQFESFEGSHPEDFQTVTQELKKINSPFVFLSGDRHMSEIMQFPRGLFGKPSFEITSSPIHSKVYEDGPNKNPWRVVSTTNKVNFTIIDSLAQDNHWFLEVENVGEENEIYYKRELAVYIKDLQDNLKEVRKRRSGKRSYRKIQKRRR